MQEEKIVFKKTYVVMLLGLLSCFLWGSAFPSIKLGYEVLSIEGPDIYSKIYFAGLRFFLAGVIIFIVCILSGRRLRLGIDDYFRLLLLGLIQTSIQYTFFYIGISNTSGTKGSILVSTSTLFAVILAHFFYKEDKLNYIKVIGLIMGFLGVTLVNLNGGNLGSGFKINGEGFILISTITSALAGLYTKKLSERINTFILTSYQLILGSLVLLTIGFIGGGSNIEFTFKGYAILLYLAFVSGSAFSIWAILLKHNGVGKVTIYKFTVPIFGVFLSYMILDERLLGPNVILGIILVSSSIILINRNRIKKVKGK